LAELHEIDQDSTMTTPEQKKSNLRLALILASVAIVFFVGFMAKMIFLGH
jgi:hypothetical protein